MISRREQNPTCSSAAVGIVVIVHPTGLHECFCTGKNVIVVHHIYYAYVPLLLTLLKLPFIASTG
jgi:hypothetical protein